jgi:Ca2+-binding RTX toxin-like protein
LVVLQDGGNDNVSGGAGDDFLYWGNAFTNGDKADGGLGFDSVGLLGTYTLAFDAGDLVSIEKLAVYSSGDAAAPNSYSLTMNDGNVAAGQKMMVVAQSLQAGEAFSFNGSAETDGSFNIRGGQGGDMITGGAKADTIYGNLGADALKGGAGSDEFEYRSTAESRLGSADTILDFAKGDKINLIAIDADGNAANGDSKFTWLGAGAFTGHAGELRVSQHPQYAQAWVVEADTNGDSVADFVLYLAAPAGFLPDKSDFYV